MNNLDQEVIDYVKRLTKISREVTELKKQINVLEVQNQALLRENERLKKVKKQVVSLAEHESLKRDYHNQRMIIDSIHSNTLDCN